VRRKEMIDRTRIDFGFQNHFRVEKEEIPVSD
jgi:hypothetical protein